MTPRNLVFSLMVIIGVLVAPSTIPAQEDGAEPTNELVSIFRDIYPDWSPDGKKVVFHSNRTSFSDPDGTDVQIFVIDLETRKVEQLTHEPGRNVDPVWSPDGEQIVYSAGNDETRDIFIMAADGSNNRRLTEDKASNYHAKWLPDGSGIIFDSNRDHNPGDEVTNREIYTMNLEGANVSRLTNYSDWDTYASVSPEGSKIVWRRVVENFDDSRNAEIFVMDRDGENIKRLTDTPAFDSYPAWSPDGQKIMFSSNRNEDHYEDFNIYMINPDGTGLEKITDTIHEVEQIRARFSPDGKKIIYNRQFMDGRIEIHIMSALE